MVLEINCKNFWFPTQSSHLVHMLSSPGSDSSQEKQELRRDNRIVLTTKLILILSFLFLYKVNIIVDCQQKRKHRVIRMLVVGTVVTRKSGLTFLL